jgi:predicted transcriptional regulator
MLCREHFSWAEMVTSFSSNKLITESAMEMQQKILSSSIGNSKARLLILPPERPRGRHQRQRQQSHRHTHEIIKQILQTVYLRTRGDHYCRPLEIVYRCELTWAQFRQYRDLLLSRKLLASPDTKAFSHYKITDEGLRYLQLFNEIEDYLEP